MGDVNGNHGDDKYYDGPHRNLDDGVLFGQFPIVTKTDINTEGLILRKRFTIHVHGLIS